MKCGLTNSDNFRWPSLIFKVVHIIIASYLERHSATMVPPGFCNRGGEVRYGSIGSLEYEVPQSRLYIVCVSTWLFARRLCNVFVVWYEEVPWQWKHTHYIIFRRPPIGGKLPALPPWRRHCSTTLELGMQGWVDPGYRSSYSISACRRFNVVITFTRH